MAKREYTEAKRRANSKYDKKTYKLIPLRLRVEDDADLIDSMETAKSKGISYREWLRSIYYK